MPNRRYVLISPGRNEAQYMRQTLDSVFLHFDFEMATHSTPKGSLLCEAASSFQTITAIAVISIPPVASPQT